MDVKLTFVVDWVGDDWLQGKRECSLFIALKKDLERQTNAVEVDVLWVCFVGETSWKVEYQCDYCLYMPFTYFGRDPHESAV